MRGIISSKKRGIRQLKERLILGRWSPELADEFVSNEKNHKAIIESAGSNKKYVVRYYIEDDKVGVSQPITGLEKAIDKALAWDCEAFEDMSDYKEALGYEPSCLVEVVESASNTIMFWANSDGDSGSDYTGFDSKIKKIIDAYL